MIKTSIKEHIDVANTTLDLCSKIEEVAELCLKALNRGNKIILAGNGGSAADSQHIAAELIGRYEKERASLPAIALTTDTSAITAIGNDYGFDKIFSRQIKGIGESGDVFIAISTSGNSKNLVEAILAAKEKDIITISLLGKDGGSLKNISDNNIIINSNKTARIQEMHILIGHLICELIDNRKKN